MKDFLEDLLMIFEALVIVYGEVKAVKLFNKLLSKINI